MLCAPPGRRLLPVLALPVLVLFSGCVGWLQPDHQVTDPASALEDPIHIPAEFGQPMFQGDIQNTGYFPGLTVPSSVQLAWDVVPFNVGTHSAAKGSPVHADGVVYAGADDGTVLAMTWDGQELWRVDLTTHSKGTHGTPLVTDDALFIGTYDGYLHRLGRDTGETVWEQKLGGSVAASPLIFEGRLYISVETAEPSGRFWVLDPATGETIWKDFRISNHPHSSIGIDPDLRIAVVGDNDGKLYAWDIDAQQHLWTFTADGGTDGDIKAPILVADGAAFMGTWDHNVYRIDLQNGTADWRFETNSKVMAGPALDPTTHALYIGGHDSYFRALDLHNGTEKWRYDTGGMIIGAATVTDNAVLFGSYDGHVYALEKSDGDRLWRHAVDGYPTTAPAVFDTPEGVRIAFSDRACDHGPEGDQMPSCDDEAPGRLWVLEGA